MATLTVPDRQLVSARYQSDASASRTAIPITKPDLQAAINAIDDWVDTNASAFNQALPLPARTALTAREKADLFFYVVKRRFEVS